MHYSTQCLPGNYLITQTVVSVKPTNFLFSSNVTDSISLPLVQLPLALCLSAVYLVRQIAAVLAVPPRLAVNPTRHRPLSPVRLLIVVERGRARRGHSEPVQCCDEQQQLAGSAAVLQ